MSTSPLHELLPSPSVAEIGVDPSIWDAHVESLIRTGAYVIALRGAGKANGILPSLAPQVVEQLSRHIKSITDQGVPVEVIYDGDEDRPHLPDIGHVFGRLADAHKGQGVSFVAAQTHDRYLQQAPEGGPLKSATGTPYNTFTFSPDLPTGHMRLTQSDNLVRHNRYEQIIVGQTGPAVSSQLADLDNKATHRGEGPVPVAIIDIPGDPAIDQAIADQLSNPTLDSSTRVKLQNRALQRRDYPRGLLFDALGNFVISEGQYPNIAFSVTSIN